MQSLNPIRQLKENDKMGIKEDIFEEFLEKLEEDKEISNLITSNLRELWKNGNLNSSDGIFGIIKRGCENASQN